MVAREVKNDYTRKHKIKHVVDASPYLKIESHVESEENLVISADLVLLFTA